MSHHKMHHKMSHLTNLNTSKTTTNIPFCCTNCTRTSISSSTQEPETSKSNRFTTISTLSHYLVQERLDQMIKESEENRARRLFEARKMKQKVVVDNSRKVGSSKSSKKRMVFLVAMEKCSNDIRHDFKKSMVEIILANKLHEVKDLRYLLDYYISMNSNEYRGIILEVFYQVCSDVFFSCKCL